MTKTKPLFEHEACGRCGGSGSHSYNMRDGSVCYGCSGSGVRLTKRGAAAQAFYTANMTVGLDDLRVGDRIRQSGFAGSADYVAVVDGIGELHQYGTSTTNGVTTPSMGVTLVLRNVKNGEICHSTVVPKSTFRKLFDAETTAARRAEALAYQATLSKTGKPLARAKAVA